MGFAIYVIAFFAWTIALFIIGVPEQEIAIFLGGWLTGTLVLVLVAWPNQGNDKAKQEKADKVVVMEDIKRVAFGPENDLAVLARALLYLIEEKR